MTSKELVIKTMKGENPGRTPIYGWVAAELSEPITKTYGSVAAFEDKYRFDMAHIFGGPRPFSSKLDELRKTASRSRRRFCWIFRLTRSIRQQIMRI